MEHLRATSRCNGRDCTSQGSKLQRNLWRNEKGAAKWLRLRHMGLDSQGAVANPTGSRRRTDPIRTDRNRIGRADAARSAKIHVHVQLGSWLIRDLMECRSTMRLDGVPNASMRVSVVVWPGRGVADRQTGQADQDQVTVIVNRTMMRKHENIHQG